MKTKNLFLMTILTLFGVIFESNGQTYSVPLSAATGGNNNVNIGPNAGSNSVSANNYFNISIGANSSNIASTGAGNNFIGVNAGTLNQSGSFNNFLGQGVGNKNTTGGSNTFIGGNSGGLGATGGKNTTGSFNVIIGSETGQNNVEGSNNVFLGPLAGRYNTSGNNNTFLGTSSGTSNSTGSSNISIGSSGPSNGTSNILMGINSGGTTTGNQNLMLGFNSGVLYNNGGTAPNLTGSANTYLGFVQIPNTPRSSTFNGFNASSTIILADGGFNQRIFIDNNGFTGIGLGNNFIPQNMLEVKSAFASTYTAINSSGLRLSNLKNTITPIVNPSLLTNKGVLSVDSNGDVILVTDQGGGITNSCISQYNIPSTGTSTTGNFSCGQIYDNGASVSIGTALTTGASITYNSTGYATLGVGSVPATGNIRLNVNGITRSVAYFATSDQKFKKDIKPIENALKTIESIYGKTYLWNKEANKEMNFDGGGHSGFIAQELEKVLPHLVATGQNGDKAVNYMELMPYLVEAIKEQQNLIKDQQVQIDELKKQISNSFKTQNADLIQFENTKIISVSPNPSNDVITISLNIEKSVQTASLQVHDLNGKLLNNLTINDRTTNINKTLQKDNFGKGVYIISLVVNGKSIDSKKIIFN